MLANAEAVKWARGYAYTLVKGLEDTTRATLREEVSSWIGAGRGIGDLEARLTPIFGPVRAEMIAVTETTRAYTEGTKKLWEASRVVKGRRWITNRDEIVCLAICAPLHRRVLPWGESFGPLVGQAFVDPPAHVRCRCNITPVLMTGGS